MEDATNTNYEYKVAKVERDYQSDRHDPEDIQDTLNEETKGEWEYVDAVTTGATDMTKLVQVIFRRPA